MILQDSTFDGLIEERMDWDNHGRLLKRVRREIKNLQFANLHLGGNGRTIKSECQSMWPLLAEVNQRRRFHDGLSTSDFGSWESLPDSLIITVSRSSSITSGDSAN